MSDTSVKTMLPRNRAVSEVAPVSAMSRVRHGLSTLVLGVLVLPLAFACWLAQWWLTRDEPM